MPSDDEIVLLYLEIGTLLQRLPMTSCLAVLKNAEETFESEADTDLGDFLNDIFKLYAYNEDFDDLHFFIRDIVYESELDYTMLFTIGSTILEEVYLNHYRVLNPQSNSGQVFESS